jgi:hypothetical protein
MPDPCSLAPDGSQCTPGGPWLLGTNGDGSLLFWQVTGASQQTTGGSAGGAAQSQPAMTIFYYRTWLDGTHVLRLTGEVGRYGPPVAAR